MAKIHNLKELNELGREIKYNDWIYFAANDEIIKYQVLRGFLNYEGHINNSYIFDYLGIRKEERHQLAKKCYGYKPRNTEWSQYLWPAYKKDDFPALERLIREIYKRLGDDSTLDPKDMIKNRFEILDL